MPKPSVLIVDDEPLNLLALASILEPLELEVVRANSGEESLRHLLGRDFALILLDARMPGMDGFETARLIKARERCRDIPLMFLTAIERTPENVAKGYEVGAVDYIFKPFEPSFLRSKVSTFIELWRRRQEALLRSVDLQNTNEELEKRVRERTADLEEAHTKLLEEIRVRRRVEHHLRAVEERYDLVANATSEGIWDWNLETDEVWYSPRWKEMAGAVEAEIPPSPEGWFRRVHPEDLSRLKSAFSTHFASPLGCLDVEYRLLHGDSTYRWMQARGSASRRSGDGLPHRVAGTQCDITSRRAAADILSRQAFYDPLTNCANRSLFDDRLRQACLRRSRDPERAFALLFLDVDHFKAINDSFGHSTGDALLVALARILEASVRPGDTVARVGGDEFCVLLERILARDEAREIVERIEHQVEALDGIEPGLVPRVSIGIALSRPSLEEPDALIRAADAAMYRAKQAGRARHEFDEPVPIADDGTEARPDVAN